jgi:hypothetical protein
MSQDFARWKAVHLPGVRDLDLRSVWRDMPVRCGAFSSAERSMCSLVTRLCMHRFVAYMLAQPPPTVAADGSLVQAKYSEIAHSAENKRCTLQAAVAVALAHFPIAACVADFFQFELVHEGPQAVTRLTRD